MSEKRSEEEREQIRLRQMRRSGAGSHDSRPRGQRARKDINATEIRRSREGN